MTARHETDTDPADRGGSGYADQRRLDTLTRLRQAALFALLPIAAAAVVNVVVFSDRLPARLATFAAEAALCIAVLAIAGRPAARRHAIPLAVVFTLGMASALLWALSLSPRELSGLLGTVPATMVATALLFPWGPGPQAIVSIFLAVGHLALVAWTGIDRAAFVNALIPPAFGVGLSIAGALELDRYRRAAAERSRAQREEAEVSATLLHVAQRLSARLGHDDVLDEVTRLTVDALGCEWSSIYVWNDRRHAYMLRANTGAPPELRAEVEQVEFTPDTFPIVQVARPGEVVELTDAATQTLVPPALLTRWEIASLIGVPVFRDHQVVGSLLSGYRRRTGAFTPRQRRLALGIANAAAIALENARLIADLAAASRLKSEFVSTMSHELRSPLNVILGFAEMARDPAISPAERERCLTRVEAAGRELLCLIESTLEVGKLEAGRDDVRIEPIPLRTFWRDLGRSCEAFQHGPGVVLEWSGDVPDVTVATDPRKLTLIVRNLVGNALKFTERGWVRADVRLRDDALLLRVADTGIGIRPDDQSTIFEMFRQADGSDSRRYGGTGLGLYIVRRFVEQLGGTIELDSTLDVGSTFVATVPVARTAAAGQRIDPPEAVGRAG